MNLREILRFRGELDRGPYLISGLVLFGIKYYVDRSISLLVFNRYWFITDYFVRPQGFDISHLSDQDIAFYATLAATSLPFIFVGTLLCMKRLRSAGVSPWLTIFFFIPAINLVLFLVLSILPPKTPAERTEGPSLLARLVPKNWIGNVAVAIGITVVISVLTTIFSTNFLNEYGWGLFLGTPFFISFGSVILYGYHHPRGFAESVGLAVFSVGVFSLFLLALALEGVFCIIMALPLGLFLALIGGTMGYFVQRRIVRPSLTMLSVALLSPLVSLYESGSREPAPVLHVMSAVEIHADPGIVWEKLVRFSEIEPPEEILFRAGISYPVNAKIVGTENRRVRHCIFNTGTFVEPIEIWEEPTLLRFSVQSQPDPLTELSPYQHIDAPHVHGYFASTQGQFELKKTGDGKTLLEGSTWYTINLWPNSYWKLWSDYIVHKIHLRVLEHIKRESEPR